MMRITDAQIHLWSGKEGPPHHTRAPYTIDRALREMDEAGINRAVNCPAIWDSAANAYADEAAHAHPDRFATMGWFPLDTAPDESLVDRAMQRPGMKGLRLVLFAPQANVLIASGALDWIWNAADRLRIPVALMVMPEHLGVIPRLAESFPGMRLILDHLSISPFEKLPGAASHLDNLLALARYPNVAVKASGLPSAATDDYPFRSAHEVLRRTVDAYGARRVFWGSDITRFSLPWRDYVTMYTGELPWLQGEDLEYVVGRGVSEWISWE